jgi:hypothetical protein
VGSALAWLRGLIVLEWVAAAAGAAVDIWLGDTLPEPLRSYVPPEPDALGAVAGATAALALTVALAVAGSIGILVRWPAARPIYAASVVVSIATIPWFGYSILHAWAAPFYTVSSLASGAALALLYLSPAAAEFGSAPAQDAERGVVARTARTGGLLVVGLLAGMGLLVVVVGAAAVGFLVALERFDDAGRRLGAASDDSACLATAIERARTGWFSAWESSFLSACLEAAHRTDAFCADVPDPREDEFETFDATPWVKERCAADPEVGWCVLLYSVVQDHCAERSPGG